MAGLNGEISQEHRLADAIAELKAVAEDRPSIVLAAGKSAKSAETLGSIIVAAQAVFMREGHGNLSLRMVAEEAGVAVGNLTYHFSTKKELLHAVLAEQLALYTAEHVVEIEAAPNDPTEKLMSIVTFHVRHALRSYRFFFQMWGYAASGSDASNFVRTLLRPAGRLTFFLVRCANPALSYSEVRRAVLQLFSLQEGYKMYIGLGPEDDVAIAMAELDVRKVTRAIVFGGDEQSE